VARFESYFPMLLRHEGGYVDDPLDPGGATNKGVTLETFRLCARRFLGVDPTLAHLKALTDGEAAKIYKPLYWDVVHGDAISLQALADIVFDFQVNAGDFASKLLQETLNDLGATPRLATDGALGPQSIGVLNAFDSVRVYRSYKAGRIEYYRRLVARRPTLDKFLRGWLNRVNSFPDL